MYFCLKTDQIPKISYMNKTDMQEGWIHFLRTAEEYILYFVRRGTMYLKEGDRKYEIREGEYILLQPITIFILGQKRYRNFPVRKKEKSEKYYQKTASCSINAIRLDMNFMKNQN